MSEEEIKLPTFRDAINFVKKKEVIAFLLIIAFLVVLVSGYKLYKMYQCKTQDGFYMDDGSCYVPEDDAERQKIIEQGHVKTGGTWDENLTKMLKPLEVGE